MSNIVFFGAAADDRVIVDASALKICHYYVLLFDLQVKTLVQSVYIEHVQRIPFIILNIKWNQTYCPRYLLRIKMKWMRNVESVDRESE